MTGWELGAWELLGFWCPKFHVKDSQNLAVLCCSLVCRALISKPTDQFDTLASILMERIILCPLQAHQMTCVAIHNGVLGWTKEVDSRLYNLAGLGSFQGLQTGSLCSHIRLGWEKVIERKNRGENDHNLCFVDMRKTRGKETQLMTTERDRRWQKLPERIFKA